MDAVILTAGRGERLRPITDKIPKPLIEIAGKPILEYIIKDLSNSGFRRIFFVVGYLKEAIISFVNKIKEKYNIEPIFIVQEELLGTAHAISLLPENISENFLVLAGDSIIYGISLDALKEKNIPLYVLQKTKDSLRKSIVEIDGNKIKNIYYNKEKIFSETVFADTSIIVLPKIAIEYAKKETYSSDIYLSNVVDKLIKDGTLFKFIEFNGKIKHFTTMNDLEKSQNPSGF